MRSERLATFATLVLWLGACAGPEGASTALAVGSLEAFRADVQPHLEERCAQSTCHGRVERPLALFARGHLRLDELRRHRDEQITDAELQINAARIAALAHDTPAQDSLVIRKPLGPERGGVYHGGGAVFTDRTDPGCRALVGWLDARPHADGGVP